MDIECPANKQIEIDILNGTKIECKIDIERQNDFTTVTYVNENTLQKADVKVEIKAKNMEYTQTKGNACPTELKNEKGGEYASNTTMIGENSSGVQKGIEVN